ncbi:uncharacterized protein LOC131437921 isoform X2 [Malaya genurostris]|uniref:uncharacterized protein LOC131437921 isoform X2 n=1 Tax=Malaya genurostris TaxID=325434 RepID=UPI0026F3DEFB|nr:uncharacterized protein LOC131437921 isoform X2 [Malaya genurostris]
MERDNVFLFPKIGLCRCCRSPRISNGVDLLDDCCEGQSYAAILKLFLELPYLKNVSTKICARCAKFVESLGAFIHQCQKSNGMLHFSLVKKEFSSEVTKLNMTTDSYFDSNLVSEGNICNESKNETCESYDFQADIIETHDIGISSDANESDVYKHSLLSELECENEYQIESKNNSDSSSKFSNIVNRKRRTGRGPSWNESHLNTFLLIAKTCLRPDGKFDYIQLQEILSEIPELSHYSAAAVKSKLFSIKQKLKEPGIPKIRDKIYTSAALDLFGHDNEDAMDVESEENVCQEPEFLAIPCKNENAYEIEDNMYSAKPRRGPSYPPAQVKTLLIAAKKFQNEDGLINHRQLHAALNGTSLQHLTVAGIKSKLYAIRSAVLQPGMPKIVHQIYADAAIKLFGPYLNV